MANYMGKGKDAEVSSSSFVTFETLTVVVYALSPPSMYGPNFFKLWHALGLSPGCSVMLTREHSRVFSVP